MGIVGACFITNMASEQISTLRSWKLKFSALWVMKMSPRNQVSIRIELEKSLADADRNQLSKYLESRADLEQKL